MVYSTNLTDVLNAWADFGVFAYLLPFLLLFAVVFGILNKTKLLGNNKGVQVTIAVAIGLLSLQFDLVSEFFADIFPYAGVGIAIVLVSMILIGLLNHGSEDIAKWIFFAIGAITFIVILYMLWDKWSWRVGFSGGGFDSGLLNLVWLLVAIAGVITWAIVGSKKEDEDDSGSSS